jgi:hypothetical protein
MREKQPDEGCQEKTIQSRLHLPQKSAKDAKN